MIVIYDHKKICECDTINSFTLVSNHHELAGKLSLNIAWGQCYTILCRDNLLPFHGNTVIL